MRREKLLARERQAAAEQVRHKKLLLGLQVPVLPLRRRPFVAGGAGDGDHIHAPARNNPPSAPLPRPPWRPYQPLAFLSCFPPHFSPSCLLSPSSSLSLVSSLSSLLSLLFSLLSQFSFLSPLPALIHTVEQTYCRRVCLHLRVQKLPSSVRGTRCTTYCSLPFTVSERRRSMRSCAPGPSPSPPLQGETP